MDSTFITALLINQLQHGLRMYRRFLEELNLDHQAFSSISRILDKIVTGTKEVFVSPIANDLTPDEILSGWDKIFEANISKTNSVLRDIELNNRSKFGPRSIAKPWSERREGLVSSFSEDKSSLLINPVLFSNVRRMRPLSIESSIQYLKNNSNAGIPTLSKKGKVKGSLLSSWSEQLNKRYPCILFTRTQEMLKTRDVFGYPVSDTLFEMSYYQPVLRYQRGLSWRAALNRPEDIDLSMTKVIKHALQTDENVISIDFRNYDRTVKKRLQSFAFGYLSSLFQKEYVSGLSRIQERFATIPIITPDGIMEGSHGVPSGSTFTNEVDSIVQYSVALDSNCLDRADLAQVQGDDGVYTSTQPDKLMQHFLNHGLEVSIDKSYISKDYCIYLQSLYHKDYNKNGIIGGIYSTYRALLRIVYLERFDDFSDSEISGKDYFAIRTLSILEQCKNNPLFKELVLYIMSIDKYKLKVSDLGLYQYVKLRHEQEGKDVTFRNWSYGEDISGLRNFESYKIIQEYI